MVSLLLKGTSFIAEVGLPLTDRGFRYGMSVFETVALRGGAPLLLEAHLAKIEAASAAASFSPPRDWLPATRAALLRSPIPEGVARIYVTAGDHDGGESRVALLFEALSIPTELSTARARTVAFTPATPFGKTGNYWPHILAQPAGAHAALLCAPDGALLGSAMANLFLIHGGRLLTPQFPVRRGVIREWIFEASGAMETRLTRDDLATAEAAFLTNSRLGLCALAAIDGRELPIDAPPVVALWRRYCTEVLRVG